MYLDAAYSVRRKINEWRVTKTETAFRRRDLARVQFTKQNLSTIHILLMMK
jgi:hypothetical protein